MPSSPPDRAPALTPEESEKLDRLAECSEEDMESAVQRFQRSASPRFRSLLDAEPVDDGS